MTANKAQAGLLSRLRGIGTATRCCAVAVLAFSAATASQADADASSEAAPRAPHALVLDVTRAGGRIVAVGDRGHVLLSDDEGRTWRQVIVPTRAMLTGVAFGDPKHGWAVGHDGVILATIDGGETWGRQDPGNDFDAIWLDVAARSERECTAVGAYGLYATTVNQGATWQRSQPIDDELHYNALAIGSDTAAYLAGEQGTLLISDRKQTDWERAEVNYEGSLFGLLPLDADTLLTYGLRGRVFRSTDGGKTWSARQLSVPVLIMSGIRLRSGTVILAGLSGNFFVSDDAGRTFRNWKPAGYNGSVSALLETADGALLVGGELGVVRIELPEASR